MKKTKKKEHYVDNAKFYQEMVEWKRQLKEAEETDEPKPQISEYIARCFMEIGENLAKKPNFMNYPFKEDMISDGVENCLMYCANFDPEKSTNPFSYFTQIIYYAFLRRIQKEKKQNYVKYKYLESLDKNGDFSEILKAMGITEEETMHFQTFEKKSKTKKTKKTEAFDEVSE